MTCQNDKPDSQRRVHAEVSELSSKRKAIEEASPSPKRVKRSSNTVQVTNVSPETTEEDLQRALSAYGAINRVHRHKVGARIVFESPQSVENVLDASVVVHGHKLQMTPAYAADEKTAPSSRGSRRHDSKQELPLCRPPTNREDTSRNVLFVGKIQSSYVHKNELGRDVDHLFRPFGFIRNIDIPCPMPSTKWLFCFVHFVHAESVDRVLRCRSPFVLRGESLNIRRHDRQRNRFHEAEENSLSVANLPAEQMSESEIKRRLFGMFSRFGDIHDVRLSMKVDRFGLVIFRNAQSVSNVLQHRQSFWMARNKLEVERRKIEKGSERASRVPMEVKLVKYGEQPALQHPGEAVAGKTQATESSARFSANANKNRGAQNSHLRPRNVDKVAKELAQPIPDLIEKKQGSIISNIPIETFKISPTRSEDAKQLEEEITTEDETNCTIAFHTWKRLPNGCSVQGCTVVPYQNLVKKLNDSASAVYWLQAPPSSGKTAVGNILQARGWKYVEADFFDPSAIEELKPDDKFCFVDQAHQLDKKSLFLLRRLAGKGSVIVCASETRPPSPHCPDCQQRSCKICMGCWSYACTTSPCCKKKLLVDPTCLSVADSPSHKLGIEALRVSKEELESYLQLYLKEDKDMTAELATTMTQMMAPLLFDHCGGLMCHIVTVLQHLSTSGFGGESEMSLGSQMAKRMREVEFLEDLIQSRFFSTLSEDELSKLQVLLNQGQQPSPRVAQELRSKGILRKTADGYVAFCPLVSSVFVHHFLRNQMDDGNGSIDL